MYIGVAAGLLVFTAKDAKERKGKDLNTSLFLCALCALCGKSGKRRREPTRDWAKSGSPSVDLHDHDAVDEQIDSITKVNANRVVYNWQRERIHHQKAPLPQLVGETTSYAPSSKPGPRAV